MIHRLTHMIGLEETQTEIAPGKWVRAVPEPFGSGIIERLRDAIAVLAGKAYAVEWPKPGDLERAYHNF